MTMRSGSAPARSRVGPSPSYQPKRSGSSGFSSSTTIAMFCSARELGRDVVERRPDVRGELVLVHQRTTSASSAFWACRRFSAWSHTADCGPYRTSSVISSP